MKRVTEALGWSGVLSIVSVVIALSSAFYAMRTYAVTHRPYVGIIAVNYRLIGNPPTGMLWSFDLKNVGSVPALVKVEENRTYLTTDGQTIPGVMLPGPGTEMIYMPGQLVNVHGQFLQIEETPRFQDVLSGRTTLDVNLRLSYESPGPFWWNNKYHYAARTRFVTGFNPPVFTMVSSDAN